MRNYFVRETNGDDFIAIKHGEHCYYQTTVYDQCHADRLNLQAGVTRGMARAAQFCSATRSWGAFEKLSAHFDKTTAWHLLDDGTLDTVIHVNGETLRFDADTARRYRSRDGFIDAAALLADLEPDLWASLEP